MNSRTRLARGFAGIPSGQAKCPAFLQKFHLDGQNAARFRENSAWTSKTSRVFAEISFGRAKPREVFKEIPLGQAKRGAFLRKSRLDEQNVPRFYKNFIWTSKASRGFKKTCPCPTKRPAKENGFRSDCRSRAYAGGAETQPLPAQGAFYARGLPSVILKHKAVRAKRTQFYAIGHFVAVFFAFQHLYDSFSCLAVNSHRHRGTVSFATIHRTFVGA